MEPRGPRAYGLRPQLWLLLKSNKGSICSKPFSVITLRALGSFLNAPSFCFASRYQKRYQGKQQISTYTKDEGERKNERKRKERKKED